MLSSSVTDIFETKPMKEQFAPDTPEWIVERLKDSPLPRAVGILRAWMPQCQAREASEDTVLAIQKLNHQNAVEAVKSFKSRKRFIRGTKGRDLKLRVTIENTGNRNTHSTNALLDSGATGSCVNREFVEKHKLEVKPLPVKMPVYNADGTLNEGGTIEGFIEVRMIIGTHAE